MRPLDTIRKRIANLLGYRSNLEPGTTGLYMSVSITEHVRIDPQSGADARLLSGMRGAIASTLHILAETTPTERVS